LHFAEGRAKRHVDLRTDLIQVLDERIVEAERELNRLRRELAAALQTDVSDDEIEQHSAPCKRASAGSTTCT
jgi:predicted phosphohydrolase